MLVDPNAVVANYVVQVNLVFRPGSNILGSFNLWKKAGRFGHADELLRFCRVNGCKGVCMDTFNPVGISEAIEKNVSWERFEDWPQEAKLQYLGFLSTITKCPDCGDEFNWGGLPDSYGFNLTLDVIAKRTVDFFNRLNKDADIMMVKMKKDKSFQIAREELMSADKSFDRYKKKLASARDRDIVFYPLKSIIKDISAGRDLVSTFKSLLGA